MTKLTTLLSIFVLATAACKPDRQDAVPDSNSGSATADENAVGDGELYVEFSPGGAEMHDPYDACFFAGPRETVVLVEFLDAPTGIDVRRECGDSDPYRHGYWQIEAKVLRTAYGAELQEFEALQYGDWSQSVASPGTRDAQAGRRELWSVRKGRTEWFIQSRWVVQTSTDPGAVSHSAGVLLPTKWSEIAQELQDTRDKFSTVCTDPEDTLVADNRLMTDAEYDVWVHTPQGDPCDDTQPVFPSDAGHDIGP